MTNSQLIREPITHELKIFLNSFLLSVLELNEQSYAKMTVIIVLAIDSTCWRHYAVAVTARESLSMPQSPILLTLENGCRVMSC